VRYARLLRFRLVNPHVLLRGMVFLARTWSCTPAGYGRLEIGRWVHIGDGNSLRCHEGSLRVGDKVVMGKDNTINCYLDIEPGRGIAGRRLGLHLRLRPRDRRHPPADQGPGDRQDPGADRPDCWIGVKVSVLRGTRVAGLRARRARGGARTVPTTRSRRLAPGGA